MSVFYRSHVRNYGWQANVKDGETSGTVGQNTPMEAFIIEDLGIPNLGVAAYGHVQDIGWSNVNVLGQTIGSTGLAKNLEAIRIGLIGSEADNYNIFYRCHIQDLGWLDWSSNGMDNGTVGGNKPVEAIQIYLARKDSNFYPCVDTNETFLDLTPKAAPVNTQSEIRDFGADEFKCRCGCGGDVKHELKVKVQKLRDLLSQRAGTDKPLVITSGYRCSYQNRLDGGVSDSLHLSGEACDLYTPGMSRAMVDEIAYCAKQVGLGVLRYYANNFCHVQLYAADRVMN